VDMALVTTRLRASSFFLRSSLEAEGALDLLLLAALELHAHAGVADNLLNAGDVALELLPRLELLAEGLVAGLELLGVLNHLLDLVGRKLADRVVDGDVGAAAGGLLGGGDLQDTVDVDLEHGLENGITGLHGGNGSKSELSEGGVVLAVHALSLEHGELHSLLVVYGDVSGSAANE
jgi:hypothetical protein